MRRIMCLLVLAISVMVTFTVFSAEYEGVLPMYRDTNETIEVDVEEEFAVVVKSNQTTGYKWMFAKPLDNTILKFKGSEYKAPDTDLIGAGGEEIWMFKAISEGTAMIVLKYVRPWEKDMYPLESKTFIVEVGSEEKGSE